MAPHDRDAAADTGRCVCFGCLCCYSACDCNNPLCLCKGSCDLLCLRDSCCLALNSRSRGCGCIGDERRGEICKIGCFCYNCGLIIPTKLCAGSCQCCCCFDVLSLPCSPDYVPCPGVCTLWFVPLPCFCCLQVLPRCGCCVAPPPSPALDKCLHDDDGMAPIMEHMEDRGNGTPDAAAMAHAQSKLKTPGQAPTTATLPVTKAAAPLPPPQDTGQKHNGAITVQAFKPTKDTRVGIGLRDLKTGAVLISGIAQDSIFTQSRNRVLEPNMIVLRINNQGVESAGQAAAVLTVAVGNITLVVRRRMKTDGPDQKQKKQHKKETDYKSHDTKQFDSPGAPIVGENGVENEKLDHGGEPATFYVDL